MANLDLKSLVKEHPSCMDSRAKLRAILMDCYPKPEYKRDINTALIIYESGLLTKLQGKDRLEPHETAAMCAKIENEYGIPPELSVKAIITWGEVWGTSVSAAITPAPKATPSAAPVPAAKSATPPTPKAVPATTSSSVVEPMVKPASKPITPVQGSVSEYVIEERKEGWFITKFQGFEQENMTVPNIIDGKLIVGLEGGVFQGCKGIKTMTISEGIRFLRGTSVANPNRFSLPEQTGIFEDCPIEQIQLPSTLEGIGIFCFERSGLKSLTIPAGITYVGERAFCGCSNLISISIPEGITYIGDGAFASCSNLTSINIPDTVIDIGEDAFRGCDKFSSVVLPKNLQRIRRSVFHASFTPNRLVKGVTGIYDSNSKLSNVVIPEGCQCIEECAFYGCEKLKAIRIPPSVTSIAPDAFDNGKRFREGSVLETIYCAPGSAAMEYARKNGITCRPL